MQSLFQFKIHVSLAVWSLIGMKGRERPSDTVQDVAPITDFQRALNRLNTFTSVLY